MAEIDSIVIVIDDDTSFRRSTERLLRASGYQVQTFDSAVVFLRQQRPNAPACVVLDVRMPDLSGLDLQRGLSQAGIDIPIIFMTGHADVPMSVRAMKEGAFEFLTKPFSEQALLHAIGEAIQMDREAREKQAKLRELRSRYGSLTPREREVMTRVVAGKLNKQVAGELHTVEKTVKFHRAHIMKKMQAQSLADLVRMAARLEGL